MVLTFERTVQSGRNYRSCVSLSSFIEPHPLKRRKNEEWLTDYETGVERYKYFFE